MKPRLNLKDFASDTRSLSSRSFSTVKQAVNKASSAAYTAGITTHQAIGDAIDHENTKETLIKAMKLATSATVGAKKLTQRVIVKVKDADANHKEVADKVETVSMGLGITSGVVAAGAALAAPSALSGLGIAIGITSAPLIIAVAPTIMIASTVAGVVSGSAYFYSKWKTKQQKDDTQND